MADAARVVLCVHLDARTLVRQARRHRAASPCVSAPLALRVSVVERLLVFRAQPLEYKTQWSTVRLTLPAPARADRLVSLQPFVGFHNDDVRRCICLVHIESAAAVQGPTDA